MRKPALERTWHSTDKLVDTNKGVRQLTLGRWLNYQDHNGKWAPTEISIRNPGPGEDFNGLPIWKLSDRMPLQTFILDHAATGGRPAWGVRRSHKPDSGILIFLEDGNAASRTANAAQLSVTYNEVLPDTDLILYFHQNRIEKWIALLSDTAATGGKGDRADLGIVLPDGWSLNVVNSGEPSNHIEIVRPNGAVVYSSKPALAVDANNNRLPCTFIDRGSGTLGGYNYRRVRVRCDPRGATYPILMDPTIEIGPPYPFATLEDAFIRLNSPTNNFGNATTVLFGERQAAQERRYFIRFDSSLIPAGTITRFVLSILRKANAQSINGANAVTHRILAANDWVEGTGWNTYVAGSASWNESKSGTQNWAGHPTTGCKVAGVDYATKASPPTTAYPGYTVGADYRMEINLDPGWPRGWRDGDFANEGVLVECDEHVILQNQVSFYSAETPAGQAPYFEITYTEPTSGPRTVARDPVTGSSPSKRPLRRPSRAIRWNV